MNSYSKAFEDLDELEELDELDYDVYVKGWERPKVEKRPKRNLTLAEMKARVVEPGPSARKGPKSKLSKAETFHKLAEQDTNSAIGFNPSFAGLSTSKNHVSNHEREWILNYLGAFYQDHLITDVLRRVKGGKEATVYCCKAHPSTGLELVAGKVYHERMFRNLKNDVIYREGRQLRNEQGKRAKGREARAMENKTRFGQDLRHMAWLSSEFGTMQHLYEGGVAVPRPIAGGDNAMLMEYIGDEKWPAPALIHVTLTKQEAKPLFDKLIHNIDLMLACERVHGDLSAHNILYWEGEATIIDLPQAVVPYANPHAFTFLQRDVKRVCQYFERYGIVVDADALAAEMWAKHIPS